MELNLKKTAAALVALGMVGVANAAAYEPEPLTCNPDVQLPCVYEGWSFGAEYLWVQTTNDNSHFAGAPNVDSLLVAPPLTAPLITARFPSIKPGWNTSGLYLEGAYTWDTGRFARLDWTHLFQRNTGRQVTGNGTFVGPVLGATSSGGLINSPVSAVLANLGLTAPAGQTFDNFGVFAQGREEHDEVNIVLGQVVLYGPKLTINPYVGVQYARVDIGLDLFGLTHLSGEADPLIFSNTLYALSSEKSKFNGIGLVAGVDAEYDLNFWNLSLVGKGQASLLAGTVELETQSAQQQQTAAGAFDAIVLGGKYSSFSDRTVVPAGKLKGGFRWTYETAYDGILTADIAYQWTGYYQVVRNPLASAIDPGQLSNFGYHGLAFGVKWQAAV
ncbi:MAG: Lpg1974 family pore-forming outer membrane protein [Gammaproteobacteria bacterium]